MFESYMETITMLGIGLTDRCNLCCPHCYSRRPAEEYKDLPLDSLKHLMTVFSNLESVNLGTGESGLYPGLDEVLSLLCRSELKVGITTNGYTIHALADVYLKGLNDVDFSLDFPDRDKQDQFRGQGVFDDIIAGVDRCRRLGIETSIAMTLMNTNWVYLPGMVELVRELGLNLRLNIYKPVWSQQFALSYEQFWHSMKLLADTAVWVSCSEPLVSIAAGHMSSGSPCGVTSLRVTPGRMVTPCAYAISDNRFALPIDDLADSRLAYIARSFHRIPNGCLGCKYVSACAGGCSARRLYTVGLGSPDPYCPVAKGSKIPYLPIRWLEGPRSVDLVHANYLCTIIVR